MTATNAIQAIRSLKGTALKSKLIEFRNIDGFPEAVFAEIRQCLATDPTLAKGLASLWSSLSTHPDHHSWSQRVLSIHHRLNGDWIKSANAAIRSGLLADNPKDQLVFQLGAVDALGRGGRTKQAIELAQRLFDGLHDLNETSSAARVAINAGNALLWQDRYAEAETWFKKALAELSESHDPFEWASCMLGLSTSELHCGSSAQASKYATAAEQAFGSLELDTYGLLASINHAHAQLCVGDAESALTQFLSIRNQLDPKSADFVRVEEFIGDCYLRLNLFVEALDAFQSASLGSWHAKLPLNAANCWLGRAQALSRLSRNSEAEHAIRTARREFGKFGNKVWQTICSTYQAAQLYSEGEFADAAEVARTARVTLAHSKSVRGAAEAAMLECFARWHIGKFSRRHLEMARTWVSRTGAADLQWQLSYLEALTSKGKRRRTAFARMSDQIAALRLTTRSSSARSAFYLDKSAALSEYLFELLDTNAYEDIQEAVRVLAATRSAALIDEILSARAHRIDGSTEVRLLDLRSRYASLIEDDVSGSSERRLTIPGADLSRVQRVWVEEARDFLLNTTQDVSPTLPDAVLVETQNAYFAIIDGKRTRLDLKPSELSSILKWIRFEILAPVVGESRVSDELKDLLTCLDSKLIAPIRERGATVICPDGALWRVPWQLFSTADSTGEFSLAAILNQPTQNRQLRSDRVAIWYHTPPGLPHIDKEVEAIRTIFPHAAVASNLREIRNLMQNGHFDLLHVATHANYHRTNPMFSSLLFDGGLLTAAEITASNFRASHVTLSACDTGVISDARGYEFDGLTRSFLGKGASTVLASQWALNDESAAYMMLRFYECAQAGHDSRYALAKAKVEARKKFEHPYFWGSYALIHGLQGDRE